VSENQGWNRGTSVSENQGWNQGTSVSENQGWSHGIAVGQTVLEAAAAQGVDLPYSCRGGVCATCKAMLRDGKVEMDANYALGSEERKKGYVLACQSRPLSPRLTLDFDVA